ncbi:MAG: phosphatidate cytidylyltransferase [Thermoflavifilum sp.]|nr:phosphatidate cytidylyltransferase [Thermoflavifilum sp.]
MPGLSPTFRKRTFTAIFFVAVMLFGLLFNRYSFLILFVVIAWGCLLEYQRLLQLITITTKTLFIQKVAMWIAVSGVILIGVGEALIGTVHGLNSLGIDLVMLSFVVIPLSELVARHFRFSTVVLSLFGCLYVATAPAFMIYWRWQQQTNLQWLPIVVIGCLWVNDTMAYIIGSWLGRHKLWSQVSPGKTWEGTIGGIVCTVLLAWGVSFIWPVFATIHWVAVASLASIFGTLGDLLESWLKRLAGVKDSGRLMPGHGGMLDRFDSLLLATPAVWVYAQAYM